MHGPIPVSAGGALTEHFSAVVAGKKYRESQVCGPLGWEDPAVDQCIPMHPNLPPQVSRPNTTFTVVWAYLVTSFGILQANGINILSRGVVKP